MKRTIGIALVLVAIAAIVVVGLVLARVPLRSETSSGQPQAVSAAVAALAELLGVSSEEIQVIRFEEVEWPDGCLGVIRIEATCLAAVTPGYRVQLAYGGEEYIYHTDQSGEAYVLASEGSEGRQSEAGEAAAEALAEALGIGRDEVVIVSVTQREFSNACLDLELADMCAQVITPGYAVLVEAGGRQYEYHTSIDVGRVYPATIGLSWERVGGIAGFNDRLIVYLPDTAYASTRTGTGQQGQGLVSELLTADELAQWQAWQAQYGDLNWVVADDAVADGMTTTLWFDGAGEEAPSLEVQQAIMNFAQNLFNKMNPR